MNYRHLRQRLGAKEGKRLWGTLLLPLPALILLIHMLNTGAGAAADPGKAATTAPQLVDSGGGEFAVLDVPHLTDADRQRIEQAIEYNIETLNRQGKLTKTLATTAVALSWPMKPSASFSDPGYFGTTNFVDQNPAYPNQRRDYACGARTYDSSSGYNHQGTDLYLWPFAWNKMAAGDVMVIAAADGVIIHREDGNQDQSCGFNGLRWNAVYVRHADGSIAWYGHLKRNSLTPKNVGDTVTTGEYLGLVGSSGNSTGPHLHFELHDVNFNQIDPYTGSCNLMNSESWWAVQPAYYDSAVNKLTTGPAAVQFQGCPSPDLTNESLYFQPGDKIYFTTYYHDQLSSQQSHYRILRPDGNVYTEWNHNSSAGHYVLSYWYWAYQFAADVPTGTWTFEVTFAGKTHRHTFYIGTPSTPTTTPSPSASPTPSPTGSTTPTATISIPPTLVFGTQTPTPTGSPFPPGDNLYVPLALGDPLSEPDD
jgi:murein DD-endopeptidase MepM/ murein hydrolase activator NlpD